MRWFETRGPVYPEDNYVVARGDELADFVKRSYVIPVLQERPSD